MTKFSKSTTLRLTSHLRKLKSSIDLYELNSSEFELKNKDFYKPKTILQTTIIRNRDLANTLLIKSVFFNLKILSYTRSSFLIRLLLKTEKVFADKQSHNSSDLLISKNLLISKSSYLLVNLIDPVKIIEYLLIKNLINLLRNLLDSESRLQNLKDSLNSLKLIIINLLKIIENVISKIENLLNKIENLLIVIEKKLNYCLSYLYQLFKTYTKGWYIYLTRFFIVTLLNIIPFIQIATKLVYTYPNPHIANALTNHLFDIFPGLLWVISVTGEYVNNEAYSFMLLAVYYNLFIMSPEMYNIPQKIAFQGTFTTALILLNHCVAIANEIVTILYKFSTSFFSFSESQNIALLKDYMKFFVKDLRKFKYKRNRRLGESFFAIEDVYKILKISESLSLVSLLSVIALLYNYVYFIIRGEKPFIPVVTKTVRRMMSDSNGDEF